MWLQFSQSLLSHSCSYLFSFFVTFPFSLSLLLLLFLPLPHPIRQTQYPSSDPRKHKFQFSLCYWLDKHIVDWEVSVLSSLASKHLGKHNLTCLKSILQTRNKDWHPWLRVLSPHSILSKLVSMYTCFHERKTFVRIKWSYQWGNHFLLQHCQWFVSLIISCKHARRCAITWAWWKGPYQNLVITTLLLPNQQAPNGPLE